MELVVGRLHVLILHLPIGMLLFAILIDWMSLFRRYAYLRPVRSLAFGIGAFSSIFACVTGYILSTHGEYDADTVTYHQWSGIISTLLALVLFYISFSNTARSTQWLSLLLGTVIAITGHLGGSLTHGEDFLNPNKSDNAPTAVTYQIEDIVQARLYDDIIQPILSAKCVSCHGPNKSKGSLRLDTPDFIIKGGKSTKPLLYSQDGNEAELVSRLHLPISDKAHMPPKQKPQLTKSELAIIDQWIGLGASFKTRVSAIDSSDSIKQLIKNLLANPIETQELRLKPAYLPDVILEKPGEEAINSLKAEHIVVLSSGQDDHFIEINFVNVDTVSSKAIELLKILTPYIIRLKLTGLVVNNELLEVIAKMPNLMRLYLDHTGVTDGSIAYLTSLNNLVYLNLNENEITLDGIKMLDRLAHLETVYAYKTKVFGNTDQFSFELVYQQDSLPLLVDDTLRIPEN